MENQILKFKTNLNCSNCVAKVQNDLDNVAGVNQWEVDTNNPEKILTINTTEIKATTIVEILKKKGFKAEIIIFPNH